GKNASGKTRTLNVINALARQLAALQPPPISGKYDVVFDHEGRTLRYQLKMEDSHIVTEVFSVDGNVLLDRGPGGVGSIWAEEIDGGKNVRFQTPTTELAAVARRDAIQHKLLEPLYDWGTSARMYYFGTYLGKNRFGVFLEKGGMPLDERDAEAVVALYRKAEKEYKEPFKQAVIRDMERLDYYIEEITVQPPVSIRLIGNLPGEFVGLTVKEKDLHGVTDQHSMSQGMFRALAIFIHVNYSEMAKKSSCLLIDDIGEGLDFDRSCRMIDLLREKAETSSVQLILSTND